MTHKKLFDDKYIGYHTFGLKINCKLKDLNIEHDYSKDYFTIEALEDGNVYFRYLPFASTKDQLYMEYSKDNGQTWTRTTNVEKEEVVMTIQLTTGEKALVRGINKTLTAYNAGEDVDFNSNFYSDILFNVYGNVMSLIHGDAFIGKTTVSENMFNGLFFDSWGDYNDNALSCLVVDASNLILPASELAYYCYGNMFCGCRSLTTSPELPATTLADNCYLQMFLGCTSLITAPKLPAITLADNCYSNMFTSCTSLTTAPELPAIILTGGCYSGMFTKCTSLTIAPELPVTTLADYCYLSMFSDCISLTKAPELPATILARGCYESMFFQCESLTTAPELPAITLVDSCYNSMFVGCTNLNYIKAMFTTIPSNTYTLAWVEGVSKTGTFVKNSVATWDVTGTEGVPSGWTIQIQTADGSNCR